MHDIYTVTEKKKREKDLLQHKPEWQNSKPTCGNPKHPNARMLPKVHLRIIILRQNKEIERISRRTGKCVDEVLRVVADTSFFLWDSGSID